jgi:predicted ATPase
MTISTACSMTCKWAFIYEQPAVGDVQYTFKHALTHDVAYNSVLNERRRLLHDRIGAALELMYAESLDDHLAELAHHYARSSNPGKGVEYCLRALRQSVDLGSNAEALALFETGLELLQKLSDNDQRAELELDLRNAALQALRTIKGWSSLEADQSPRAQFCFASGRGSTGKRPFWHSAESSWSTRPVQTCARRAK